MPPLLLEALLAGDNASAGSPPNPQEINAVADLLVSQCETSDVLILNKIDLVDKKDNSMVIIDQIVRALNSKATVVKTSFGEVPLNKVLAVAGGKGTVEAGVVDDHRDAILAAEQRSQKNGASEPQECSDPDCTDNSHSHSHHDHSHSHSHDHDCSDPDCADESHNHAAACNDPDCTDTSHTHSHSQHTTTLEQLGIGSFVFRSRKPFHPKRLVSFLRHLPLSMGLPERSSDDPLLQVSKGAHDALQRVVRSKGFVWLGDSNLAANYWSHAGTSFELQCLGRWWSTLSRQEVCRVSSFCEFQSVHSVLTLTPSISVAT